MKIILLALMLCGFLFGSEATTMPTGGVLLASGTPYFRGSNSNASGVLVDCDGAGFTQAMRLTVPNAGVAWDVEAKLAIPVRLEKGHTLAVRLWLRAISSRSESGDVALVVNLQQAGPDWYKPFSHGATANRQWREIILPFINDRDFPAEGAELSLHCGDRVQVLEIGKVELWSYGTTLKPAQLPRARTVWAGMEPDAPWRKDADARIERIRKGDLAVKVVNVSGSPVSGVAVRIRQQRHAFPFGTAVTAARLMGTGKDDEIYRKQLLELFNAAVLENDLKWPAWNGEWGDQYRQDQTLSALRWLKERQFLTRGHVMVWPGWDNLPGSVRAMRDDPDALRQAALTRIDQVAAATDGLVAHWDVLNEPFVNHDLMDVCGQEVMVDWFKRARQRLPSGCKLFINEFGIVAAGGATDTPQQAHYENTIRYLIDQGAPLEGIGVQSHFGTQPTPPLTAFAILDRFSAFKVPIVVTEFDINTADEEYQAAYTRDYLTLCFSHPNIAGFLIWGFWEGSHWIPQAAMLRKDWTEKPNLSVWRDLIYRKWWTDVTVKTDAKGTVRIRGFKGTYSVEVDGKSVPASIGDVPTDITIGR